MTWLNTTTGKMHDKHGTEIEGDSEGYVTIKIKASGLAEWFEIMQSAGGMLDLSDEAREVEVVKSDPEPKKELLKFIGYTENQESHEVVTEPTDYAVVCVDGGDFVTLEISKQSQEIQSAIAEQAERRA